MELFTWGKKNSDQLEKWVGIRFTPIISLIIWHWVIQAPCSRNTPRVQNWLHRSNDWQFSQSTSIMTRSEPKYPVPNATVWIVSFRRLHRNNPRRRKPESERERGRGERVAESLRYVLVQKSSPLTTVCRSNCGSEDLKIQPDSQG
jgi:hypothetical protein